MKGIQRWSDKKDIERKGIKVHTGNKMRVDKIYYGKFMM